MGVERGPTFRIAGTIVESVTETVHAGRARGMGGGVKCSLSEYGDIFLGPRGRPLAPGRSSPVRSGASSSRYRKSIARCRALQATTMTFGLRHRISEREH